MVLFLTFRVKGVVFVSKGLPYVSLAVGLLRLACLLILTSLEPTSWSHDYSV